jgi:hypothetical protein
VGIANVYNSYHLPVVFRCPNGIELPKKASQMFRILDG